jgi:hypothetical protein
MALTPYQLGYKRGQETKTASERGLDYEPALTKAEERYTWKDCDDYADGFVKGLGAS